MTRPGSAEIQYANSVSGADLSSFQGRDLVGLSASAVLAERSTREEIIKLFTNKYSVDSVKNRVQTISFKRFTDPYLSSVNV